MVSDGEVGLDLRIVVDDGCIMSGECIYNHPAYFDWDEDGTARPVRALIVDDDDRRHAEQAVAMCPAGAISLHGL